LCAPAAGLTTDEDDYSSSGSDGFRAEVSADQRRCRPTMHRHTGFQRHQRRQEHQAHQGTTQDGNSGRLYEYLNTINNAFAQHHKPTSHERIKNPG